MFSLVSGLWRWLTRKDELWILVVGIDNAGKTTSLEQIKRNYRTKTPAVPFERITPTIGLNLCHVDFDRRTSLVFWDLGGQLMLRSIWENHYKECHGLLFVIDSSDKERLSEVRSTLLSLVGHTLFRHRAVPLVLLVNKQDAPDALSPREVMEALNIPELFARTRVVSYCTPGSSCSVDVNAGGPMKREPFVPVAIGGSALSNVNITAAITALVVAVRNVTGPQGSSSALNLS